MLTQARLKELLHYDPETGLFRWKVYRARSARAGSLAGVQKERGRIIICLDQREYKAHRLAWFYMTGAWPKNQIDHIDCNAGNNAFANLREATNSQNHMNKVSRNSTGFKGVKFDKRRGKWDANIKLLGKVKFLGSFKSPEAAYAAYCDAAKIFHGEFARVA